MIIAQTVRAEYIPPIPNVIVFVCFLFLAACTPITQHAIDLTNTSATPTRLTTPTTQTLIMPAGEWRLSIPTVDDDDGLLDISITDDSGIIIAESRSISVNNRFTITFPNLETDRLVNLRLIPAKNAPRLLIANSNPYPDGQWGDNPQHDLIFSVSKRVDAQVIWGQRLSEFLSDRGFAMRYCTLVFGITPTPRFCECICDVGCGAG